MSLKDEIFALNQENRALRLVIILSQIHYFKFNKKILQFVGYINLMFRLQIEYIEQTEDLYMFRLQMEQTEELYMFRLQIEYIYRANRRFIYVKAADRVYRANRRFIYV